MASSDIASIGIIVLCGLLALRVRFRWFWRLLVGCAIGCVLLGMIGIASRLPWSGQIGSFFESGDLTPYMARELQHITNRISHTVNNTPNDNRRQADQKDDGLWASLTRNQRIRKT